MQAANVRRLALLVLGSGVLSGPVLAQNAPRSVVIPESSVERPLDVGHRAHTNIRLLVPARSGITPNTAPYAGYFFETPASLACIYGLVKFTPGCSPGAVTLNAPGGSKAVAIVDAYDDPTALADLTAYSKQFGLPAPTSATFQVVYASGSKPAANSGWQAEEALDTQIVHGLAPGAKVILVEAASNSYGDMFAAEQVAAKAVAAAGGGEVSNSWGGTEFSAETTTPYTAPFTGTSTVFFASTGDEPYPGFPAVLPTVVAVGGTSTSRDPATGAYKSEASWTEAGAGPSLYVPRPSFQSAAAGVVGIHRGLPDVSLDANPETGVWVTINGQWYVFGGTSVSSPMMAAITNIAGHFAVSTSAELTALYANLGTPKFNDVKRGTCGNYQAYDSTAGYDLCTGIGSPAGLTGE